MEGERGAEDRRPAAAPARRLRDHQAREGEIGLRGLTSRTAAEARAGRDAPEAARSCRPWTPPLAIPINNLRASDATDPPSRRSSPSRTPRSCQMRELQASAKSAAEGQRAGRADGAGYPRSSFAPRALAHEKFAVWPDAESDDLLTGRETGPENRLASREPRWKPCLGTPLSCLRLRPATRRTRAIDELRAREFARLDALHHVYLDYTGSGLYAASQIERHSELLLGHVLGNPHSSNPTSALSTRLVERCRQRVLDFFGADPAEYAVVFTANASHALKLVGESYPFAPGDQLLLTFDNHNSVNGIREFDRAHGRPHGLPADGAAGAAGRRGGARSGSRERHPRRPQPVRLSRPSPTSPGFSIRWSGSRGRRPGASTCCSTPPPSCPRTGSTWAVGTPISWPSPSTRCSDIPRASGRWWPAGRRWPSFIGPGSPAGPSTWPRYRPTASCSPREPRLSRTGPSTSRAFRRWSWASTFSSPSASI